MGDAAFFPTGILGDALAEADFATFYAERGPHTAVVIQEHQIASESVTAVSDRLRFESRIH